MSRLAGVEGYDGDTPVIRQLVDALEGKDPKAARTWRRNLEPGKLAQDERRANRQAHGTIEKQKKAYAAWVESEIAALEDATNGYTHSNAGLRRRMKAMRTQDQSKARLPTRMFYEGNVATVRANASDEALEWFAEHPPLPFDAWRYHYLGARDKKARDAWNGRQAGYLSEWG